VPKCIGAPAKLAKVAAFDGGDIVSDGGASLLQWSMNVSG
jgi:hypothetical protein